MKKKNEKLNLKKKYLFLMQKYSLSFSLHLSTINCGNVKASVVIKVGYELWKVEHKKHTSSH